MKSKNVVLPHTNDVGYKPEALSKTTVPVPQLNVPPDVSKVPSIVMVWIPGTVRVPPWMKRVSFT